MNKLGDMKLAHKYADREVRALGNAFLVRDCYIWQSDLNVLRHVRSKCKLAVLDDPQYRDDKRILYMDCLAAVHQERELCREFKM